MIATQWEVIYPNQTSVSEIRAIQRLEIGRLAYAKKHPSQQFIISFDFQCFMNFTMLYVTSWLHEEFERG